jgi:hypothetical protein
MDRIATARSLIRRAMRQQSAALATTYSVHRCIGNEKRRVCPGVFVCCGSPIEAYCEFWMLDACLPLGPCTTSNWTFWPSFSDLNPFIWIALK